MPDSHTPFWRRHSWDSWRRRYLARTPPPQRRAWVRFPTKLTANCQPASEGEPGWPALVQDISLGGINFLVNRSFDSGALLRIELEGNNVPGPLLVRVIHVSAKPNGQWAVGGAFASELDEEDLRGMRARRQRPPPSDSRAWVRFPCDLDTTFQDSEAESGPLAAKILDCSAGGLALLVAETFERGTLLCIELPRDKKKRSSRTVLARVVHVRGKPGNWILGCTFTHQLSDEQLKAVRS